MGWQNLEKWGKQLFFNNFLIKIRCFFQLELEETFFWLGKASRPVCAQCIFNTRNMIAGVFCNSHSHGKTEF